MPEHTKEAVVLTSLLFTAEGGDFAVETWPVILSTHRPDKKHMCLYFRVLQLICA